MRRRSIAILASLLTVSATSQLLAQTAAGIPGFDTRIYPGDSAMHAWLHPASPYQWVGDYLTAPCHRDSSFAGKYSTLTRMGWGVTAIYVGQQDFSQMPVTGASKPNNAPNQPIICSATLLTAAQGTAEAGDAVAKMRADGFPSHSAVFLDVEQVTNVSPALLDYVRAWMGGVLRDGRYRPGIYAALPNVPALYAAAGDAYHAANAAGTPPVWASSGIGFSLTAPPTAVGLDYATVWQGVFGASQTWNGVTLVIDANVAASRSPGTRVGTP